MTKGSSCPFVAGFAEELVLLLAVIGALGCPEGAFVLSEVAVVACDGVPDDAADRAVVVSGAASDRTTDFTFVIGKVGL